MHCSNSKGHFTAALLTHHKVGYGNHYVYRNAGTISSVGHVTKYGGSGGSAGIGAGTTAGANGQSGGGGGIVIVSDSSLSGSISTSVSGGSLSGNSGSDGSIIVVVNQ
jgi:hypothetical protein